MKRLLFVITLSTLGTSLLSINPVRDYKLRPEAYKLKYEQVKIATDDDILLNAWVMPPAGGKQRDHIFILAGSDAGNMGFLLNYAALLVKEGFTVVTFDYRGFGESSDFDYDPAFLYHTEYIKDFTTVVDWTKVRLAPDQISVMSFSMGTLIAVAGYQDSKFDGLIAEGFIVSPREMLTRIAKQKDKTLKLPESGLNYESQLQTIDIPVLLFAGTEDQTTTLVDAEAFAGKAPDRRVIAFEGAHLRGAAVLGFPVYIRKVVRFIG